VWFFLTHLGKSPSLLNHQIRKYNALTAAQSNSLLIYIVTITPSSTHAMMFPVPAATNIPFSALPLRLPQHAPQPVRAVTAQQLHAADQGAFQAALSELLREERLNALVDELGEAEMEISEDDDDDEEPSDPAPAAPAPSTITEAYKATPVGGLDIEAITAMESYAGWSAEELRVKDYAWGIRFGDPEPGALTPPSPQQSNAAKFFARYVLPRSGHTRGHDLVRREWLPFWYSTVQWFRQILQSKLLESLRSSVPL
jgi:hypothetical protein